MSIAFPIPTCLQSALHYHKQPLALYQHLCQQHQHVRPNSTSAPQSTKAHSLLLESAEIQTKDHLKSVIMPHAALMIRADGHQLTFTALSNNGEVLLPHLAAFFQAQTFTAKLSPTHTRQLIVQLMPADQALDEDSRLKACSPFIGLRLFQQAYQAQLVSQQLEQDIFLGGILAYDLVASTEQLPNVGEAGSATNSCPDYLFYLAESLIVLDHQQETAQLTSFSFAQSARMEIEQQHQHLLQQAQQACAEIQVVAQDVEPSVNVSDQDFCQQVIGLKEHILAGNIFQVVPSRTFSLPCDNPLGAYQVLRETNPSPYMFYVQTADFTLFGASPESALKYDTHSNQVEVYPIAGTRPRGKHKDGSIDLDLDTRIELDLRLDKKELAEHIMLVDLARNDVARIAKAGKRHVAELLKVDRYSHVMHLVSRVVGELRDDLDALHAYQACMNMGTLVGAPKIRAAQLIREVERMRRGTYGGAVGYLNAQGDMDTCIIIRSAFVKQGIAHVQAGAGVVFDSNPQAEADETRQKAQAVLQAIRLGGGMSRGV